MKRTVSDSTEVTAMDENEVDKAMAALHRQQTAKAKETGAIASRIHSLKKRKADLALQARTEADRLGLGP